MSARSKAPASAGALSFAPELVSGFDSARAGTRPALPLGLGGAGEGSGVAVTVESADAPAFLARAPRHSSVCPALRTTLNSRYIASFSRTRRAV